MAKLFNSHLFKNLLIGTLQKNSFNRSFHGSSVNMVGIGDSIPSVDLYEGTPGNVVNIADLCKDKLVVLFGLPGAFTPGCSKTHLPGYVERYNDLKSKGVDEVVCVSVNDAFVMDAWGKHHGATGKIRMMADPDATFTTMIGLNIHIPRLGGTRSKRYVMVIRNGIIKVLHVEPDGTGLSCSLAPKLQLDG